MSSAVHGHLLVRKAIVDETRHRWNHELAFPLLGSAVRFSCLQLWSGAIVNVRTVSLCDRILRFEDQLLRRHTCCAKTSTHIYSVVVSSLAIEVSTVRALVTQCYSGMLLCTGVSAKKLPTHWSSLQGALLALALLHNQTARIIARACSHPSHAREPLPVFSIGPPTVV